ncbi:helix-turn-helix domain-containing protein [Nostoc sp.]|jgi:transcriptional regulator with XRE-family HTH domain|uniref:helix-turn-helix domain-containing protein n=2 Tax=Nostoc TaxID=1177 RepID=UPI0018C7685A|nr:helix-turn-helix transcriptional regulator [Nostoc sp. NZL]MBN3961812.1 helix-turn-helix transcriptional regulator [Nostoc sp. NMS8]
MKRYKFMSLLERRGLTQEQFAEKVESAWKEISGRKLSRQAVSAWINGRAMPNLSPAETLVVIEILGCTLTELAMAFPHNQDLLTNGVRES